MSAEANAAGKKPASTTSRFTLREQLHGARYGEVLFVTGRLNRIEATVYNTLEVSSREGGIDIHVGQRLKQRRQRLRIDLRSWLAH